MGAINDEPNDGGGVGRLLQTISEGPLTPSTVDIDRAVQRGRAVRRFRGAMAAGLAVVAIAGLGVGIGYVRDGLRGNPSTAATAAGCTVSELDMPPGIGAIEPGRGIVGDPTGRYFAAQAYPEGGGKPVGVLWDNGVPKVIAVPGRHVLPRGVNEHGTVVGTHDDEGKDGRIFRYANGSLVDLPAGPHLETPDEVAINGSGVVVATMEPSSRDGEVVVKYAAGSTQPVTLPGQDAVMYHQGVFVTGDGTVLSAQSASEKIDPQVVKWAPDGTKSTVTHPAGFPSNGVLRKSTSSRWLLVGNFLDRLTPGVTPSVLLWNTESGDTQVITSMVFAAANANGHVAGTELGPDSSQPVVIRDGVVTALPKTHSYEVGGVGAIGDNGTMAGVLTGNRASPGTYLPVIWRGC